MWTALGAALAVTLLAAATINEVRKSVLKSLMGRGWLNPDDHARRGALAIALTTVAVDWDTDVQLLEAKVRFYSTFDDVFSDSPC